MLGKWDSWYQDVEDETQFQGNNVTTYEMAGDFLADMEQVEDWGCGFGGFKKFCKGGYIGVDGTTTPYVDVLADLVDYKSSVDGIMMRHVLEHNYDWEKILDNAMVSFNKKMCLVIFTPFAIETHEISHNRDAGVDAPNISFNREDIEKHLVGSWTMKTVNTNGFQEYIYFISKQKPEKPSKETVKKPRWTILIATIPYRADRMEQLMSVLLPQVEKFKGEIDILIYYNNLEHTLGAIRQELVIEADGEYVSHIDDDDMVPEDYCATILPLLDGVDYIGFKVDYRDSGRKERPVYHSLKYQGWSNDDNGYYRDISHLNPIKREIALRSVFPADGLQGEDHKWSMGLKPLTKTEHFIDREMYIYEHHSDDTIAYVNERTKDYVLKQFKRPEYKSKYVRYHSKSTKDTP
jgi:hypothetical protein